MTQLISYKNDPKLKQMMVEEAQKHKKEGENYPCKNDIFEATYENVNNGKINVTNIQMACFCLVCIILTVLLTQ